VLSCLNSVADLVDAIDSPELQIRRGWDLSGWRYELVPWGVRFLFEEAHGGQSEVVVLVTAARRPEVSGDSRLSQRAGEGVTH
jgi:hypothetical protein